VLSSLPVRVGFITQLLWQRYGAFWTALATEAGAETVLPSREETLSQYLAQDQQTITGTAPFRLAQAQASALRSCDTLLVPELNPDTDSGRGGAQDFWIADFPAALRTVYPYLPRLIEVPAYVDASIEPRAVAVLRSLLPDAALVERSWHRLRALLTNPYPAAAHGRAPEPKAAAKPRRAVALVGQPWLLTEALLRRLVAAGESYLSHHDIEWAKAREEGWRSDPKLVATDAEVLGTALLLSRRAEVREVRFIVDAASPTDRWLANRVRQASHLDVKDVLLQEMLDEGALLELLAGLVD